MIVGGPPGRGGYVRLAVGPDEDHARRADLAAVPDDPGTAVLTVAHLSDLHLCDAQSPARVEFLDRWSDPDSPVRDLIGEVGTYRAQELLTAQVTAAMVDAVNRTTHGPVAGAPIDLAVSTGDNTDNAQANELDWYLTILDGGTVHPDSGDPARYEGVADAAVPDDRYWHPEADADDLPRSRWGLPAVPGLLTAARRPFTSPGLSVPWLAVHGNHDQMLQGTWPGDELAGAVATGASKGVAFSSAPTDPVDWFARLAGADPAAMAELAAARQRPVTADERRRVVTRAEWITAHHRQGARPAGHGFAGGPYYRHDHSAAVTFLVLDTVNEHGGWQGSMDVEQLDWLDAELTRCDEAGRYAVLASHHPVSTLVNDRVTGGASARVLAAELLTMLSRHPAVVLWLNGHTHATAVVPHGSWWEVTAPSLIDWPQQGRVVELLRDAGGRTLTIAATMLDHGGTTPWGGGIDTVAELAGLSRELAANDWQFRDRPLSEHLRDGRPGERNVLLGVPDPFA